MKNKYICAVHLITESSDHYTICIEGDIKELVNKILEYYEPGTGGGQIFTAFLSISQVELKKFNALLNKTREKLDNQAEEE